MQAQWPIQQTLPYDQQWQGSVMGQGSSRHLLAVEAFAPSMSQSAVSHTGNDGRPDWVRYVTHWLLAWPCTSVHAVRMY